MAGEATVTIPAIQMQLDRWEQPDASYQICVVQADGTVLADWKRWSECRLFAQAMMLHTLDAPSFPARTLVSVLSSDMIRYVSSRCLDPDYLEMRRSALEVYFRRCHARSPAAVERFLGGGRNARTSSSASSVTNEASHPSTPQQAAPPQPPAPQPPQPPPQPPQQPPPLVPLSASAASPPSRSIATNDQASRTRRSVSFRESSGRRSNADTTPASYLVSAALLGLLVSFALGSGSVPLNGASVVAPAPSLPAIAESSLDVPAALASSAADLVCAAPNPNGSEQGECCVARDDDHVSVDADAPDDGEGCACRKCDALEPPGKESRRPGIQATPAALVLYAVLAAATLAPREALRSWISRR